MLPRKTRPMSFESLETRETLSAATLAVPAAIQPDDSVKITGSGYPPRSTVWVIARQGDQILASDREHVFSSGQISRRLSLRPDPHPGTLTVEVWNQSVDVLMAMGLVSVLGPIQPVPPKQSPEVVATSPITSQQITEIRERDIARFRLSKLPANTEGRLLIAGTSHATEFRTDQSGAAVVDVSIPHFLIGTMKVDGRSFEVQINGVVVATTTLTILEGVRAGWGDNASQNGSVEVEMREGRGKSQWKFSFISDNDRVLAEHSGETDGSGYAKFQVPVPNGIVHGSTPNGVVTLLLHDVVQFRKTITVHPQQTTPSGSFSPVPPFVGGPGNAIPTQPGTPSPPTPVTINWGMPQPAPLAFWELIHLHFSEARTLGIYANRPVAGTNTPSLHAEGRALDVGLNAAKASEKRLADALFQSLIEFGRDLGLVEIIWNRQLWTPTGGLTPYRGRNSHRDHIHIGWSRSASQVSGFGEMGARFVDAVMARLGP